MTTKSAPDLSTGGAFLNGINLQLDITSCRPCRHLGDRGHHRLELLLAHRQ